jgi:hypothetical protein
VGGVRWWEERGSSSLASVFGVMMFLGLLLVATQVLVHLYATSMVTAVAFDEARRASAAGADGTVRGGCDAGVEPRVRSRLGRWGASASVECRASSSDPGTVTVRVTGPSPARSLAALGVVAVSDIDRSATFRTEVPPADDP